MKKVLLIMGMLFLLVIASACGNDEVDGDGKGPADIPVQWANAMIQRDEATRAKLLVENNGVMTLDKGPENIEKLGSYELTEWKASNDKYFYEINFVDPISEQGRSERMEVVKTEDGWKRTKYGNLTSFESLIAGLEGKVLKELHEE
jgi:hypothetical protein